MAHNHHGAEPVVEGTVPRASSAMNITPMIDVLLVLLVIFMVSLPLGLRSLDVSLPADTDRGVRATDRRIVLEYTGDRRLSVNTQPVAAFELEMRLREIFADRSDKTLYVMAAGSLSYGDVVQVIDAARGAGVLRVGVVTERMRGH